MTMDGLGGALGFEGKNMSVRISQYETGARIPGDDMIQKLADALHCNYKAISDYSLGAAEDIIETLFWLEESASSLPARGKGTRFPDYTAPGNLIHLRQYRTKSAWRLCTPSACKFPVRACFVSSRTHLACIFSEIFRENTRKSTKDFLRFFLHLSKNLTTQSAYVRYETDSHISQKCS